VAELCIRDAVANRSPSAAGLAIRHSQQLKMIKSISALAIFVALGASAIALPGFAPAVRADEAVAFAKTGRLASPPVAADCASQVWPNIASSCLRDIGSGAAVPEARLVTARR
jgi:hypothetical protein